MQVSRLSLLNFNSYKRKNETKLVSSPVRHDVISFSAASNDEKIAKKYFKTYSKTVLCLKPLVFDEATEGVVVDLFKKLKKEPLSVRKAFLKINEGGTDSAFAQSLFLNNTFASEEILSMYEKTDEQTRANFLVPQTEGSVSPFLLAADCDITLKIPKKLRAMVKKLSPENQGLFYYYKPDGIVNSNYTILEDLRNSGYYQFAEELQRDKLNFGEKYPDIAQKYIKMYEKPPVVEPKESEKEDKKPTTFRVYENVKTRFSDVGGMFNVKKQIQNELLEILNNPKVKNADKPSGIILYGPPGTGKTLLATAIAGEAGVPFISTAGSGFNEIYVGSGAKRVRELFEEARNLAQKSPSKTAIVFIDEADAVAGRRSGSSNKENDHTLNALLAELDGVQTKEETDIKIITILATNRRDMFDEAFRKGRIDLEFKIDDPRFSENARKEILQIVAKGKPFKNNDSKEKILSNFAQSSSGMSGAELADVIKRAYRKTLYKSRKTPYITMKDVNEAKLEALVGIKNDCEKSLFEQKSVLAHEAGHAINQLIMNRLFANENEKSKLPIQKIDFIVNESRGNAAGLTMMKPSPENDRLTIESLISYLVVGYGGYSIEEEMFDGHTDGVSSDLNNNTDLILKSVTKWGLGSKTKYIGCSPDGLSFELFKSDIKQDIIDYSDVSMKISSKISAFVKPFIVSYIDTFLNAKSDKAAIITGENFEKMFDKWLKQNGNKAQYDELCVELKNVIQDFKAKMKN